MSDEASPATPTRTFHPAGFRLFAWFVDLRRSTRVFPVVGYYDDGTITTPAVLFGDLATIVSVTDIGPALELAAITDNADTGPGTEKLNRAHERITEPKLEAAWAKFHSTRPHDACGHNPPDGWWASQPDDASWGPGEDTPEAAKLRAELSTRYRLRPEITGCLHENVDCSVEFCGREPGGELPASTS